MDITITSPLGLEAYPLSVPKAKRHLNDAETAKRAQLPLCETMGWGHHPAAYSLWGGAAARSLLFEVLRRATADQQGWAKTQRILDLRRILAVTLAREVAKQWAVHCRVLESVSEGT